MAKYVDLPNLKENLTNFLNKKIDPIYAKKTEIPSNVSELNNDKSYQTAEEVGKAVTDGVAKIVAGAPEDFDTLKEMSDWISSHETSAAAMNSAISDNSVAIANHTSNSDIHVTKEEKTKWNKLDSDLKDGTIIVAEATKATQDAQGNVIDATYAKKTEVPQGTVVDDALSSTSTNPVQNKVVKAEFDQVNSNLSDLKMLGWSVPKECPVQNYVDSDGVFHQKVGRVDLGSLDWQYETGFNRFVTSIPGKFKPSNQSTEWPRGLYCVLYEANTSPIIGGNFNMTISGYTNTENLYLCNFSYTDATTFKNAMQGVYLYYELETPITMTIDGNEAVTQIKNDLGGLSFSASGTTLSITNGTNTWTLSN